MLQHVTAVAACLAHNWSNAAIASAAACSDIPTFSQATMHLPAASMMGLVPGVGLISVPSVNYYVHMRGHTGAQSASVGFVTGI